MTRPVPRAGEHRFDRVGDALLVVLHLLEQRAARLEARTLFLELRQTLGELALLGVELLRELLLPLELGVLVFEQLLRLLEALLGVIAVGEQRLELVGDGGGALVELVARARERLLVMIERVDLVVKLRGAPHELGDAGLFVLKLGAFFIEIVLKSAVLLLGGFERALMVIAVLVLVASMTGLTAVLLTMQSTRTREMAILRAVGASPWTISFMYIAECLLLVGGAALLALGIWFGGLQLIAPWLSQIWGIHIGLRPPDSMEWLLLAGALGLAFLVSLIPAIIGYRRSLAEGLTPRE